MLTCRMPGEIIRHHLIGVRESTRTTERGVRRTPSWKGCLLLSSVYQLANARFVVPRNCCRLEPSFLWIPSIIHGVFIDVEWLETQNHHLVIHSNTQKFWYGLAVHQATFRVLGVLRIKQWKMMFNHSLLLHFTICIIILFEWKL